MQGQESAGPGGWPALKRQCAPVLHCSRAPGCVCCSHRPAVSPVTSRRPLAASNAAGQDRHAAHPAVHPQPGTAQGGWFGWWRRHAWLLLTTTTARMRWSCAHQLHPLRKGALRSGTAVLAVLDRRSTKRVWTTPASGEGAVRCLTQPVLVCETCAFACTVCICMYSLLPSCLPTWGHRKGLQAPSERQVGDAPHHAAGGSGRATSAGCLVPAGPPIGLQATRLTPARCPPSPHLPQCRKQLKGHINSLRDAHVALELYPMVAPGEAFEVQPFWRAVSTAPIGVACRRCGQGGGREVQALATGHAHSTACMLLQCL